MGIGDGYENGVGFRNEDSVRGLANGQYFQRPKLKLQNSQLRDEELQNQINLARQESKQLYVQIDKIKGKIKDATLPDMTK